MTKFMFQAPLTGNEQALVRGIACLCHVIAEQHEELVKHNHYGQPVPEHSSATAESAFWEYMGQDGFDAGEGGDGAVDRLWGLVKPLVDEYKKMDDEGKEADAEREKKEKLKNRPYPEIGESCDCPQPEGDGMLCTKCGGLQVV